MEVADILSQHALEVAFASAMSIAASNGSKANHMQLSSTLRAQLMEYFNP